jgi:hypothetical protein
MENVITRQSNFFTEIVNKIQVMEAAIERMREVNLSSDVKWLNSEAVMRKLGISKRTLQNYRDTGILPHSIVGGKFFYNIRDIEELMANNYVSAMVRQRSPTALTNHVGAGNKRWI